MKTCPNCAKELPDHAQKCKYCDYAFFAPTVSNAIPTESAQTTLQSFTPKTTFGYFFAFFSLLALIAAIIICVNPTGQKGATSSSPVQSSNWVGLASHIFTGVEVFYGENKAYGFKVLGAAENCKSIPSGKGVYVKYPNGKTEWKDRDALLSGNYYIRSSDANKSSYNITTYDCP